MVERAPRSSSWRIYRYRICMEPSEPRKIRQYELIERIGEGKTGVVYKAFDSGQQRVVALKIPHPEVARDPVYDIRAAATLKAVARLDHPNICHPIDLVEHGGRLIIVTEFVTGNTIAELVASGLLPTERCFEITIQIVRGLDHAHHHRIRHGNIQPSNIMVRTDGQVLLLDFGLPRRLSSRTDDLSAFPLETIPYVAPEEIRNQRPHRVGDMFSIGALFCYMLSGVSPFEAATHDGAANAVLYEQPDYDRIAAHGIPRDMILLLKMLLAKKKADRCADTDQLLVTLESIADYFKKRSYQPDRTATFRSPRLYLLISLLAILLVLVWSILAGGK